MLNELIKIEITVHVVKPKSFEKQNSDDSINQTFSCMNSVCMFDYI